MGKKFDREHCATPRPEFSGTGRNRGSQRRAQVVGDLEVSFFGGRCELCEPDGGGIEG